MLLALLPIPQQVRAATGPLVVDAFESPFVEGSHAQLIARVTSSQTATYQSILKEFDEFLETHPDDAVATVEKCLFIENFAFSEDSPIDGSEADLDACRSEVGQVPISSTEVGKLYHLSTLYGKEAREEGAQLLREHTQQRWSRANLAKLYERLYEVSESGDASAVLAAERHAWSAVQLDPASTLRFEAANYLVKIGSRAQALQVLQPNVPVTWPDWKLPDVARLLVDLGQPQAARKLIDQHTGAALSRPARQLLARLLADQGDLVGARKLLLDSASNAADAKLSESELRDRYEFERDFGSSTSALAAYRALRATGWNIDPLARERLHLLLKFPGGGLSTADLVGVMALLLLLVLVALSPLLILAPIHYRSLVKQQRGIALPPATPWSLGHLWYAVAMLLLSGAIAAYVFAYPVLATVLDSTLSGGARLTTASMSQDLGQALLWQSVLAAVLLLPLLRRRDQRQALRGDWSVHKCILVGLGAAVGLRVLYGLLTGLYVNLRPNPALAAMGDATTQSLQGMRADYGLVVVLTSACLLVPFVEELVFRGVFVQSASRHLRYGGVVLLQAAAFAAMHEDMGAMPLLFGIALVAAWLAQRSGGLIAPMALHAANNFLAVIALEQFSRVGGGALP